MMNMNLLEVVTPPSIYQYMSNIFCHARLFTNDYFTPNYFSAEVDSFVFPCYFVMKTDGVYQPWSLSSGGDFLGVLSSNFLIFRSMWRSSTRE